MADISKIEVNGTEYDVSDTTERMQALKNLTATQFNSLLTNTTATGAVVQAMGDSETAVMSQKAVTDFVKRYSFSRIWQYNPIEINIENQTITFPYSTWLMGDKQPYNLSNKTLDFSTATKSAIIFIYNITTAELSFEAADTFVPSSTQLIIGLLYRSGTNYMSCNFNAEVKVIQGDYNEYSSVRVVQSTGSSNRQVMSQEAVTSQVAALQRTIQNTCYGEPCVIGIAHRGLSSVAPENTKSALIAARKAGFKKVEIDVHFTSDGVPVIIHDSTVDRTSNGSGNVADMTLEELKALDFGSWFSSSFEGEKILTFEECMALCRKLSLVPCIELKTLDEDLIKALVPVVKKYGLKVEWLSDRCDRLAWILEVDNSQTVVWVNAEHRTDFERYIGLEGELKTGSNRVKLAIRYDKITEALVSEILNYDIDFYAWTVDDVSTLLSLNPFVTGVMSNTINATEQLYKSTVY